MSHISQTGSVYTTVAVTIERYVAVVHPRRSKVGMMPTMMLTLAMMPRLALVQVMCTKRGASISILGVTCFAILFNCTKFFELEIARQPNCTR